ncbi:tRNA(Ile)-lysidine synthase [Pseudidiomarina piscicola]|uniref:tRNA(Ile)-lysidine synthase n=1 Tax=Pseudidiomarina piscicola TaxID=2614830 RepID=A0A6S6WTY3_9GAMM|nr:tRNA lysidine(34) synthetase TilS [Pseudidiomarina piscicola]CAB0150336.1 tRNA(Ile)-lysidine synthase [Pseudidiomarina piscicola]VZT39764.1 tRNA(Ile)-lysidine synthase [Pseudomonas aeruginosa]
MDVSYRDLYPDFCTALENVELRPEQQLVACLGGGADSQTVLDLLDRWRQDHPQFNYLAIHLDHQFHPDSGHWAEGLVDDCQQRQFPMYCEVLAVPQGRRTSKEAAGREARYQRLGEIATDNAILLVGQHRNDQIETFLLQLKRGAGPKGLAAMAQQSESQRQLQPRQTIVRPLLGVSKAEIYAYAKQHQLFWIEDDTNYDTRIERNFLRHKIVPELEQRWPHFGDAVLRSAQLCAEQQQVLEELLSEQLMTYQNAAGELKVEPLASHSPASQRALLRTWLQQQNASMPSYAQLEQIRRQMIHTKNDRQPEVSWGRHTVKRTSSRHLILGSRNAD